MGIIWATTSAPARQMKWTVRRWRGGENVNAPFEAEPLFEWTGSCEECGSTELVENVRLGKETKVRRLCLDCQERHELHETVNPAN